MSRDEYPDARKPNVLFLCVHNAARSQMAEALLKKYAGDRFEAHSAGLRPTEIHPLTVRVLKEAGLDISGQQAKGVYEFLGRLTAHYAVMVCQPAEEGCPTAWPFALSRLTWPFDDPAACQGTEEERLAAFRAVRDQIDARVREWLEEVEAETLEGGARRATR